MFLEDICIRALRRGKTLSLSSCYYDDKYKHRQAPDYYRFLAGFCYEIEADNVLEIGTYHGGSSCAMRICSNINSLITIDIEELTKSKKEGVTYLLGDSNDKSILNNVQSILNGEKLDLLYVDSVHTYEHVLNNLKLYGRNFHPRYVILDDIHINLSMDKLWNELIKRYAHMDMSDLLNRSCGFGVLQCQKK